MKQVLSQPVGSRAVEALEAAWRAVRRIRHDIPEAVLVVLGAGRRAHLGHFANSRWRVIRGTRTSHEVAVSSVLFRDAAAVLGTLLHEAAHAALWETGRGGVSPDGYYHRKEFRDKCRAYGLECTFWNTRYGWSVTRWPEGGPSNEYTEAMEVLKKGLRHAAGEFNQGPRTPPRKLPPPGLVRLVCGCTPPRSIYAGSTLARSVDVRCERCEHQFKLARRRRTSRKDAR